MQTLSSPFVKRIASSKFRFVNDYAVVFEEYDLAVGVLEFLSFEEWQVLKNCSKRIRNNVRIRLLQNDNNWNLTMNYLAPYILK